MLTALSEVLSIAQLFSRLLCRNIASNTDRMTCRILLFIFFLCCLPQGSFSFHISAFIYFLRWSNNDQMVSARVDHVESGLRLLVFGFGKDGRMRKYFRSKMFLTIVLNLAVQLYSRSSVTRRIYLNKIRIFLSIPPLPDVTTSIS